jgi:hypothetical protein
LLRAPKDAKCKICHRECKVHLTRPLVETRGLNAETRYFRPGGNLPRNPQELFWPGLHFRLETIVPADYIPCGMLSGPERFHSTHARQWAAPGALRAPLPFISRCGQRR